MIKFGRNNDFVKYKITFFFLHAQSKARTVASWSRCQSDRMCAFKPYMRRDEKLENSEGTEDTERVGLRLFLLRCSIMQSYKHPGGGGGGRGLDRGNECCGGDL